MFDIWTIIMTVLFLYIVGSIKKKPGQKWW